MIDVKKALAAEVERVYPKIKKDAEAGGYHLNPDVQFAKDLILGLLVNEKRYGYWACPCRLASGIKNEDLDIICPCDYRDADLAAHEACYCALYVSARIGAGKEAAEAIPDRRPPKEDRDEMKTKARTERVRRLPTLPIWRCKVCGYLYGRDNPPDICQICKAGKDRFEVFA